MPKGGLLHAHFDAMVDARTLLQLAMNDPLFHVRAQQPLTTSSLATTLPEFSPLPIALKGETIQLGGKDYSPGTWVPVQAARASFPEELGGSDGFDKWVIDSMVLNPTEAYHTYNSSVKVELNSTLLFRTLTPILPHRSGISSRRHLPSGLGSSITDRSGENTSVGCFFPR